MSATFRERLTSKKAKEKDNMTWDTIYGLADGAAFGSEALRRKDNARYEIVSFIKENFNFDLEAAGQDGLIESVEEWIDAYVSEFNIVFDNDGKITGHREITEKDKENELSAHEEISKAFIADEFNNYDDREFKFDDDPLSDIMNEPLEEKGILPLAYTTFGSEEQYEINVAYDLIHEQETASVRDDYGTTHTYREDMPISDFKDELETVTFNDYVTWAIGDHAKDLGFKGYDKSGELTFVPENVVDRLINEKLTLHIRYAEPIKFNGFTAEKDTIDFADLQSLEAFAKGELAYDILDNSVKKKDNEILLYAENEKGETVWGAKETPKYNLTRDTLKGSALINENLYRLMALKDFTLTTGEEVHFGELGGLVENENNLSQDGNCWITKDAIVRSNAKVVDNALVDENAIVEGNAIIKDDSKITNSAIVGANVIVSEKSIIGGYDYYNDEKQHLNNVWAFDHNHIVPRENKEKATEKPKSMLSQIKALGTQSSKDVAKDTHKREER